MSRLVREFKYMFSVFKQHLYVFSHIFLPIYISKKFKNYYLNKHSPRF